MDKETQEEDEENFFQITKEMDDEEEDPFGDLFQEEAAYDPEKDNEED